MNNTMSIQVNALCLHAEHPAAHTVKDQPPLAVAIIMCDALLPTQVHAGNPASCCTRLPSPIFDFRVSVGLPRRSVAGDAHLRGSRGKQCAARAGSQLWRGPRRHDDGVLRDFAVHDARQSVQDCFCCQSCAESL